MPRPVYIICCKSGVEDRESSLISLFFVIEKFLVTRITSSSNPPTVITEQPFRVVAAWLRLPEDDAAAEFDYELSMTFPAGGPVQSFLLTSGVFKFDSNRPLHRFTVNVQGILPLQAPGVLLIQSKIRQNGAQDWLSQDYPVIIENVDSFEQTPPTSATETTKPRP